MAPLVARDRLVASNIRQSYVLRILLGCFALCVPTLVLLWEDNGLTLKDALFMQAVFAASAAMLDVPAGYLADLLGRKPAIIAASIFIAAGSFAYCIATNFLSFLLGEILLSLGFSLCSGADQALLYDSLVELGREDEYERIWGKGTAYNLIGISVFTIIGGLAGTVSLRLPCYIVLGCSFLMILITLQLVEPHRCRGHEEGSRPHWREISAIFIQGKARLRWLILFPALVFALQQAFFWLYQPYFELARLPLAWYGTAFAAFNLAAACAASNSHQVRRKLSEKQAALLATTMIGVSYVLIGSIVAVFSIAFILLVQLVRGYQQVAFSELLNREIASNMRASMLSAQSMASRGAYALLLIPTALGSEMLGLTSLFLFGGIAALAAGWAAVAAFYAEAES